MGDRVCFVLANKRVITLTSRVGVRTPAYYLERIDVLLRLVHPRSHIRAHHWELCFICGRHRSVPNHLLGMSEWAWLRVPERLVEKQSENKSLTRLRATNRFQYCGRHVPKFNGVSVSFELEGSVEEG